MSENVIIAIIGACGAVLAAVIAGVFGLIKQSKSNNFDKKVKIRQSAKGSNNTQIGIQNIAKEDESLKTHPYIVTKKESIHQYAEPYNQPAFSEGYMSLTDFGREFCEKTVIEIVTIHLPPIQL